MPRITITLKFIVCLASSLLLSGTLLLWTSLHFMTRALDFSINSNIEQLRHVVDSLNSESAHGFMNTAAICAAAPHLQDAVLSGDLARIQTEAIDIMTASGSDFALITDADGNVLARGHSQDHGDNLSNLSAVASAMKGTPFPDVVTAGEHAFSLCVSTPIFRDGKIIGTLSIGSDLGNPSYVDRIKQATGRNVTVFKGDTRLMTTIMQGDKRAVGTKLQDKRIIEATLKRGETYIGETSILGVPSIAAYWPIRSSSHEILGLWFIGSPLSEVQQLQQEAVHTAVLVGCLCLLVMIGIAACIGRRIGRPIRRITAYAAEVARDNGSGSTKLDVYGRDDMGQLADSLRHMVESLRQGKVEAERKGEEALQKGAEAEAAMKDAHAARERAEHARREGMLSAADAINGVVRHMVDATELLSAQIARCSNDMDRSSTRLAETAAAMEEMNSTVIEVARNAGEAANASAAAKNKAREGDQVVEQSVSGIRSVQNQSQALKQVMENLDGQARDISRIMGVISDIADQTNLLALNAAIEAARAGDAGRGFAVVADEVRKLAEKTMASTADVSNAIHSIQESAALSVAEMDRASHNIEQAAASSNLSGESLRQIVTMVESAADQVHAIATASEEQSATSEEIARSISDVSKNATEAFSAMRQAEHALEKLREQEKALVDLIQELQTES